MFFLIDIRVSFVCIELCQEKARGLFGINICLGVLFFKKEY